ncbi:MAG: MBL fold metallo-hydrolase [Candidatus Omnitrophica bacterium]|nr:MBL fold metallo-hydrolase [Candidatus Omnitrophota bacterium]
MADSLRLIRIPVGRMGNFAYLAGDAASGEAVVVDPGWDGEELIRRASQEELTIRAVLLTHGHYDHSGQARAMTDLLNVPAYVDPRDEALLPARPARLLWPADGLIPVIPQVSIKAIHTPGHTQGSNCFLINDKHLLTGDTLFVGACGRCDLETSDPEEMYRSLSERLGYLADDVKVYPGHDYGDTPASTMGNERRTNPYLMCTSLERFLRMRSG